MRRAPGRPAGALRQTLPRLIPHHFSSHLAYRPSRGERRRGMVLRYRPRARAGILSIACRRPTMKYIPSQLAYLTADREARTNLRTLFKYLAFLAGLVGLYAVLFHLIKLNVE